MRRLWRDPRARWITGGVLVVLLLAAGAGAWVLTGREAAKPPAPVTVAADRGAVTVEVATTGTVQPAGTRSLSFTVAGTVETVAVRPGSVVSKGQRLATVDDADAAEAVADAEDALDEAQGTLDDAREAAEEEDDCTTAAGGPTASPTTAAPRPSPSPTCPARQQSGTDQILAAEQRVNRAVTALQDAEDALAGATLTAPIAGTVLTVAGTVGAQVNRGAAFLTLADTGRMQVTADVPEADAGALAVGQDATVTLTGGDVGHEATVVQVDPVGAADGGMVRYGVLLGFEDAPDDLLVGQSAAVRIVTGEVADALRVPSTAVHDVRAGSGTVRVGGADRRVTVGLRGDSYTEVKGGLTAGEAVVRSW